MTSEYSSLLSGSFDVDGLPDVPSKVIRVYLCSNPTDMGVEKHALMKHVFPTLREYSREKHGLELQIVDCHWGMDPAHWVYTCRDQALCMQEIERCQQLSVGPNFLALIGQNYGDAPLVDKINAVDFELIRAALRRHRNRDTRDACLLDYFYKRDIHAVPMAYVLQNMDDIRESLKPKTPVERLLIGEEELQWEEVCVALRRLIRRGVEYCIQEGTMVESDATHLYLSDFEQELRQGIFFSNDPNSSCQVYTRDIVDLKNYTSHHLAPDYIQLAYNEKLAKLEINSEFENRLSELKQNQLPRWLSPGNIKNFSVLWKHDQVIDPKLHEEYLSELCQSVGVDMKRLIDYTALNHQSAELPEVVDEVFQHWLTVGRLTKDFGGRTDELDIIQSYVVSNDCKPLVLHGETGYGCSSLISKAASMVSTWVSEDLITVIRFVGVTVASLDIRQLLHSVCLQLATLTNKSPKEVPTGYLHLVAYFHKMLETFPSDRNLVLFLGKIHLLLPQHNAHDLSWLPQKHKENVKIIITTAPDVHSILHYLQSELIQDENNFVELKGMTESECFDMLDDLLRKDDRCISGQHREVAQQAFSNCSSPLFVKLFFTDARTWASYDTIDASDIPTTIKEYIGSFFDRLERTHGKVLVSRSLGYLTASATGLSDSEMEDVLSLDDCVLNEVFRDFEPSIRRIPSLIWLRLKSDLQLFLFRKQCEGITVNCWSESLIVEAAKARYLTEEETVKNIHSGLADYMLGKWHKEPKPYKRASSAGKEDEEAADRLVLSQPLTFKVSDTEMRYNKRKYDQVPRHLYLSGRMKEFNDLVLFSYSWLYNKTKALSLDHILSDFEFNACAEAGLVEKALQEAQSYIVADIDTMGAEIVGRLLAYYPTHANIRKLIQECDMAGLQQCALVPNFPYHQVTGSPLRYTIECPSTPTSLAMVGDDMRYIYAKEQSSQSIKVFDMSTGEHKGDVLTSVGVMHLTPDGRYVLIVDTKQKAIKIHNSCTGQYKGQLIPSKLVQLQPKEKSTLGQLSISNDKVAVLIKTEKTYLCVADIATCKFTHVIGLEAKGSICQITPNADYIFCGSSSYLLGYKTDTMVLINSSSIQYKPTQMVFSDDARKAYMINDQENKVHAMTLSAGVVEFMHKIVLKDYFIDDQVNALRLSNDQQLLLLVKGKSNLAIYNTSLEQILCHIQRPADIPTEFKLPKSHYIPIEFTEATFSPDGKFVIGAILRNVYVWNVSSGALVSTLQAPVGIIEHLLVPNERGQIVTHLEGSNTIQVWGLEDTFGHVGTLDRLTTSVREIQVTRDSQMAFVCCDDSDELGVLDMNSGQLKDLLTHDSQIVSFSVSASGDYVFVALDNGKLSMVNKIWNIPSRKIIHEFGSLPACSLSLQNQDSFIALYHKNNEVKSEYHIAQFKFLDDLVDVFTFDITINFLLQEPFVTVDDRYLVVVTADEYDEKEAFYTNPTICAIPLFTSSPMHTYTVSDLQDSVRIRRILNVRPCPDSSYTVIVLYTNEGREKQINKNYEHCFGLLELDVCSGVVCQSVDELFAPNTDLGRVFFNPELTIAIDNQSHIFYLETGYFVKKLYQDSSVSPQLLAINGQVAVYYKDQHLFAIRIKDGKCLGQVDVHGKISSLVLCADDRTLVVGCKDGSIVSYILLNPGTDDTKAVLAQIKSRQEITDNSNNKMVRSWDKIGDANTPPYSRPPSVMKTGVDDKDLLAKVKHLTLARCTTSDAYSRSCVVM